MKSNNKPDSLVAACFGMVASFLIITTLSGCGGGAGSGGIDPNNPGSGVNGPDIANGTISADGNTFTISSFKTGLSGFVAIDDADHDVTVANAVATVDTTAANATEGDNSVNLTVTALPTVGADPWIGLVSRSNGGLANWSPYRYLRFSVKTGADGFGGMLAIKSGSGFDWCGGAWATIPANSSGTVELDLTAPLSGGCTARNLADVRHLLIFTKSIGTYYIDNVRLVKGTPTPVVTDIADATTSPDGNTFTISSFRTGLGAFSMIENAPGGAIAAAPANVTATLDTVATHAAEGSQSVDVNFIAPAASLLGLKVDSSGLSDWTPFRYVRFDVTTGATAFDGTVIVQSGTAAGGWNLWCDASGSGNVPANSTGTITLDMDACGANINKATVQRLQLRIDGATPGHFYIDNVRLVKGAPAPADTADATTSADGNTFTVSSFAGGLGGFSLIENIPGAAPAPANAANGAATQDSVPAHATDGTHSVDVNFIATPASGNWLGLAVNGNAGLADWTPFRYVRFDVTTGASAFDGTIIVQSNTTTWSGWCQTAAGTVAANSTGTLTLDMNNCSLYGNTFYPADVFRLTLRIESTTAAGHFYIDNVRLTKN